MAAYHLDHITPVCRFRPAGIPAFLLAIAAFWAAVPDAAAQGSECSLRGADTVLNTGVTVRKCLDLDKLKDGNVVIPANVTRIDNSGFSLCESSEQSGGDADIVYVIDQSGSMGIRYIWISQDMKDTVYLESTAGCTSLNDADANGFGTLTIPNDAGTRQIPRLNPAKSTAGCRSFSGDPFNQRGIAFKQAIDFQAARAPRSTAGFMGFSSNVLNPVRPLQLNLQANINRVKAAIAPSLNNNTNYKAPLDTAKKWLLTPSITTNQTKAVIFLSDGLPTWPEGNADSYLDVLGAAYPPMPGTMPPVFGIFMGRPSGDTAKLYNLSKRTGGSFFLIPPSRPDSLKAVVERILNVILRQYQPTSAVVTNNSLAPAQIGRAGATDFTRQADGHWQMNLDKPVGIKAQDGNAIDLKTELVDVNSGALKPNDIGFTLTATGPFASANMNLPGTQFGVTCTELPPGINVVKPAYIKDTDGDGAGDKVFFVFARPLAALPDSIAPIYWNQAGAGFDKSAKTNLSFLVGSGNTVVIADFTATPFPKGMTSVPDGAKPVGVLQPSGVFQSQRPEIQDSIGPILLSAQIKPFNVSQMQPGADINIDTIVITASEGLRAENAWNTLLLWSKSENGKCTDYAHALVVVPKAQPSQDAGHQTFTILVPTGTGSPTPVKGDCVYLNTEGIYTDLKRNVPPIYGVILDGRDPPRKIELFRGYPPVVGLTADRPGFVVVNNDPRKGNNLDYSSPDTAAAGKYTTFWIPPVGFNPTVPFNPVIPDIKTRPIGLESKAPEKMPPGVSAVQVVSTGKYIVDINIYDNNGGFVRKMRQAFGFNGELDNRNRITDRRGLVSYLVWDLKDSKNQVAGQGVYIWKAVFRFDGGKEEVQYTKTGVLRSLDWYP